MVNLITSEWERIWARPKTRLLLIAIPFVSLASAWFYRWNNLKLDPGTPFYVSAFSFPYMILGTHLALTLSLLLPLLAVDTFTGEFESAAIRTVLMRPFTRVQVYVAKLLSLLAFTSVAFVALGISAYAIGWFILPHTDSVALAGIEPLADPLRMLWYTLGYYGLGFLTLVAWLAVATLLSLVCHSTTSATTAAVAFWVASLIATKLPRPYLSLQGLQVSEMPRVLAGTTTPLLFLSVAAIYTVVAMCSAGLLFTRRDV